MLAQRASMPHGFNEGGLATRRIAPYTGAWIDEGTLVTRREEKLARLYQTAT